MLVMDLTAMGMQITDRQEGSAMSFLAWIVLGLFAGFIVSKILNKTGEDRRQDCLLGVVGAIVGGFLSNLVGKPVDAGLDFLQPPGSTGWGSGFYDRVSRDVSPEKVP